MYIPFQMLQHKNIQSKLASGNVWFPEESTTNGVSTKKRLAGDICSARKTYMSYVHMVQVMSAKRFEISKESCAFLWFSSWMMIIYRIPFTLCLSKKQSKTTSQKEWCKKDHQSQNSEICRRCHANHTMKSWYKQCWKKTNIYKKKTHSNHTKSLTVVGKRWKNSNLLSNQVQLSHHIAP